MLFISAILALVWSRGRAQIPGKESPGLMNEGTLTTEIRTNRRELPMRSPGRAVAEWVVADPRRFTLAPRTDVAFYTAMTNTVLFLIALGVVVLAVSLF